MSNEAYAVDKFIAKEYEHGFVTELDAETLPPGLNEQVIRTISAKKNEPEFMLQWRLQAYEHWLTIQQPNWAHLRRPAIDFQAISYYSAPKQITERPKSLDEVDPELLATYNKLGIPLDEQMALAGVAVDAIFDSVSVFTTFKDKLADAGVIFCPI